MLQLFEVGMGSYVWARDPAAMAFLQKVQGEHHEAGSVVARMILYACRGASVVTE